MNTLTKTSLPAYLLQGQIGLQEGGYPESYQTAWLSTATELAENFYFSEGLTLNSVTGEVTGDAGPEELEILAEEVTYLIDSITLPY